MEFVVDGKQLNISDELIEEYLRRTDVYEDILELALRSHLKCVLLNQTRYDSDLNVAIEQSIREELELWEER